MGDTRKIILAVPTALVLVLAQFPTPAVARAAAIPSDFNGDGYADLAIGVPNETVGTMINAGAVNVLYGSRLGLVANGDQYWTQDSPGIKGESKHGSFGFAIASGDFDGDGYADIAIGAPNDRVGGSRAGAVNVLYGASRGLTAAGDQRWSRENLPGVAATDEAFGSALATGDFDGDGYWDLAIGAPGYAGTLAADGGLVEILYGGTDGLTTPATELRLTMTGEASSGHGFGGALATGDLNGDDLDDLAVGVGGYSSVYSPIGGGDDVIGGFVAVFFSTVDGISADDSQLWSQVSPGLEDDQRYPDQFGWSLAIGDFDADGYGDLAIGVPGEGLESSPLKKNGRVVVLRGTPSGPTADGSQDWHKGVAGLPTNVKDFGWSLAVGDFDGDGYADLAIGAPGKKRTGGSVVVLRGTVVGLTGDGNQSWTQGSPGVPGAPEHWDEFGASLAAADFGRSGRDDLAIGQPGEDRGRILDVGAVTVLFGRTTGLDSRHAQRWSQATPGVKGAAEAGDQFGSSLAH
jgi:FG-GAP repeat